MADGARALTREEGSTVNQLADGLLEVIARIRHYRGKRSAHSHTGAIREALEALLAQALSPTQLRDRRAVYVRTGRPFAEALLDPSTGAPSPDAPIPSIPTEYGLVPKL